MSDDNRFTSIELSRSVFEKIIEFYTQAKVNSNELKEKDDPNECHNRTVQIYRDR